jgi:hypothetical protein
MIFLFSTRFLSDVRSSTEYHILGMPPSGLSSQLTMQNEFVLSSVRLVSMSIGALESM